MSDGDPNATTPDDADLAAAEYVLGVLPAEERRAAAERLERDAAFAREVERWEAFLLPLADAYRPEEPPPWVKIGIDQRLFAGAEAPAEASARPGLWQSLAVWRGLATAAVLAISSGSAIFCR